MAVNNFKPFSIGNNANVTTQADYEALPALESGFSSGKASSAQINKALRQGTVMSSVLAQFISNLSGNDVLDDGDTQNILDGLSKALKVNTSQVTTGIIGDARNARMAVVTPSSTATFTADELIVGTALGGLQYRLGSFSKTINLATTGAGGMDAGSAPASGYVALYAIYNPTTSASALLAVNATSVTAPTVYGGVNMPAGYTASALVSVFGTNSSGLIKTMLQVGRHIDIPAAGVFSSSTKTTVSTPTSLASAVPKNAISFDMVGNLGSDTQTGITANLYADNVIGAGQHQWGSSLAWGVVTTLYAVSISVPQTIYYNFSSSAGTLNLSISVSGYSF